MNLKLLTSSFVLAGTVAGSANAATMSLADIMAGDGTFVTGDKILSDFSFTTTSSNGASEVTAAGIELTDVMGGGDYGVDFELVLTAFSSQYSNLQLHFKVSVDPAAAADGWVIDGASLSMFAGGNNGDGGAIIVESIYQTASTNGPELGSMTTSADAVFTQLFDSTGLAESTEIYVHKDISVSGGAQGAGHISGFSQFYSQSQVPEPASLALMGLGGLAMIKRRK